MNKEEKKLYNSGMNLVKLASTATTIVRKKVSSGDAATIPKDAGSKIDEWLRSNEHILYGSLPMKRQMFKSRPAKDVDLAVEHPREAAQRLNTILANKTKLQTRIIHSKGMKRYAVQVKSESDKWIDAIDIHTIGMFYGDYDVYGSTLPPYSQKGIQIQTLADQLLRKANSVLAIDKKTGRFGATPDRELKDVTDFVNVSKMLIESKELRARASLARVKEGREAIKIWEDYARKLDGYGGQKKVFKDQISTKKEKAFIAYALKHPEHDVRDLVFTDGKVIIPKTHKKKPGKKVISPYSIGVSRQKQDVLEVINSFDALASPKSGFPFSGVLRAIGIKKRGEFRKKHNRG